MPSRRKFIAAGLGLGASSLAMARAANGTSKSEVGGLMAGAGRQDVAFGADSFPLDGFVGQHDPLSVRVLLLAQGQQRIAIVVVDLTSIFDELITRFKGTLAAVAGVTADNVIVCASHTFSAPHIFLGDRQASNANAANGEPAARAFDAALNTAALQAVTGLQPARAGSGSGISQINVNRDVLTPRGWWLGADDTGFADHALEVLRIDGGDGRPLAVLMNFSVQPSVMDESRLAAGGRLISADLAGAAARHVEARYPGSVAMFLIGAAGDQSPSLQASRHVVDATGHASREDVHEAGFLISDLLGERLGNSVVQVAEGIKTMPEPDLALRRVRLAATAQARGGMPAGPVGSYDYRRGGQVEIPVVLVRIGDFAFVGMQPELAASVGAQIRARSPFARTFVVTMVDGAAKYLPDASSYDRFTYEARSSPYVRGTAETTAAAIAATLQNMSGSTH